MHLGTVRGVAWNQDATRALTVSDDAVARIWERAGDKQVQLVATLRGHKGPIRDGIFTPTGEVLTVSDDATLRVWGKDGEPLSVVRNHKAALQSVVLSPDGQQFLTSSFDGRAQSGYVYAKDVEQQVSYLITRLLSEQEREDFGLDPM